MYGLLTSDTITSSKALSVLSFSLLLIRSSAMRIGSIPWLSTIPPSIIPNRPFFAAPSNLFTLKSSGNIIGSNPLGKHEEQASASPNVICRAISRSIRCSLFPKIPNADLELSVLRVSVTWNLNGSPLSKSVALAEKCLMGISSTQSMRSPITAPWNNFSS